eukprot:jgi/Psemu1/17695/gm1.17695_g
MPSSGGRTPGCGNYTKAELESMFAAIRAAMPVSTDDWDDVRALHAQKYPGRDKQDIVFCLDASDKECLIHVIKDFITTTANISSLNLHDAVKHNNTCGVLGGNLKTFLGHCCANNNSHHQ